MKFVFLFILLLSNCIYSLELQKPKVYKKDKHEVKDWLMSEKLDGIRAYWNGKELLSKNGNKIYAPSWFTKNFPNFELDGELWTKRNDFENIQNIVLDKKPSLQWKEITYNIFEVPNQESHFLKRLEKVAVWLKNHPNKYIKVIPQIKCKDKNHLDEYLEYLVNLKAEGIIIKNPNIEYFKGRSNQILKVKKFEDMEGRVVGINYHKNRKFKSLIIKLENEIIFNLGNGFTKKQRLNHPKVGDIVAFKYYNFTKFGKPKFASFLRIRKLE